MSIFCKKKRKKIIILAAIFLVVVDVVSVLTPRPVYAALPVVDFPAQGRWFQDYFDKQAEKIQTEVIDNLAISAMTSVMNGVTYLFRKLAYDTATYITSGGPGQGSLIDTKDFGQYMWDTFGDSVGQTIGDFGDGIGLNLCQLPDLNLQVFLQIGMRNLYGFGAPKPRCEWQKFKDTVLNPEAYSKKYGDPKYLAEHFSANLSVQNSDFGIALGGLAKIDNIVANAVAGATNQRLEGSGIEGLTDLVTKQIKTPAELVKEDLKSLSPQEQKQLTNTQLLGAYFQRSPQLILTFGNVFLNTLASQLLKKIMTQGLIPTNPGNQYSPDFFGIVQNNRAAVQQAFATLFVPSVAPLPNYDAVNAFSTCPDPPAAPGLDNCVMDEKFRAAVDRSSRGESPLTLQEAINANPPLINGGWSLISPLNEVKNTDRNCYKEAFCYSNIQKLRKARILPLGFEIAALKADPAHPPTLQYVMDHFNDCAANGQSDAQHPFCHLINPNWVIKAPAEMCHTYATGPELVDPDSSQRRQECLDLSTCVLEDDKGNCIGNKFGFCTQEKNIWRLGGNQCPVQFNTCKTFTNKENGQQVSYLSKTLDFAQCSAETVGCRAYATEKDLVHLSETDPWLPSVNQTSIADRRLGRMPGLYFNNNSQSTGSICLPEANGCTAFYPALVDPIDGTNLREVNGEYVSHSNTGFFIEATSTPASSLVHLKKAPDYLGCYDFDLSTTNIDWPASVSEATQLASSAPTACGGFASACAPAEVGCELYKRATGATSVSIPGIVGNNRCEAVCAGYDTFRQEASKFDAEKFPIYLNPNNANTKSCQDRPEYVGCDEFTNLEDKSSGGEKLEYYTDLKYCEKPNGTNSRVYYSWEGSYIEGYVLRVHTLLPINDSEHGYLVTISPDLDGSPLDNVFPVNSPAYDDDTKAAIENNYGRCNATLYSNRVATNGTGELVTGTGATAVTTYVPVSDPDCKALYDDQGAIFYRLVSNTVTVDNACHLLRKSITSLSVDPGIEDENTCNGRQGIWENGSCQRCTGGGRFIVSPNIGEGGYCQYQTIDALGESATCRGPANDPGKYNGCRAYVGNTGNNRRVIFTDTFEPGGSTTNALAAANPGWDDNNNPAPFGTNTSTLLRVSSEALRVSEYSLLIDQNGPDSISRRIPPNVLHAGATYELTFWARSLSTQNISVHFEQRPSAGFAGGVMGVLNSSQITLGNAWRQYKLGPVAFTGLNGSTASTTLPAYLVMSVTRQGAYFIDNVELTQLQDRVYIIKDSWKQTVGRCSNNQDLFCNADSQCGGTATCQLKLTADVPLSCDSNPTDSLPGAALGCSAYTDSRGVTIYAAGFESLCREAAVGCRPLWDTHNTVDNTYGQGAELVQAYNVWCDSSTGSISANGETCTLSVGFSDITEPSVHPTCTIPTQQQGCYVEEKVIYPNGTVPPDTGVHANSMIVIPADTPVDQPIFLADKPEVRCKTNDIGCMELGQESSALRGASYTHTPVYIKNNPDSYHKQNGEGILCRIESVGCTEYDDQNGGQSFAKDPNLTGGGTCTYRENVRLNNTTYNGWFQDGVGSCSNNTNTLCRTSEDCGSGNTCNGVGVSVPCYQNYLVRTNGSLLYDIHSNSDSDYAGAVGVCSVAENGCTEFIDPVDTSNLYPNGHPYYALFDNEIKNKINECNGQVSQTEGCVLFDQTENPVKLYRADLTYEHSEQQNPPYSPIVPLSANDVTTNDANLILKVNRDRTCSQWLACQSSTVEVGVQGNPNPVPLCYKYKLCDATTANDPGCTHWVPEGGAGFNGQLTESNYSTRDTSWQGVDYSGYSLFNKYQIGDMDYVRFDLSNFTALNGTGLGETSYAVYHLRSGDSKCESTSARRDTSWDACGPLDLTPGRCYGGQCLVPIIGGIPESAGIQDHILPPYSASETTLVEDSTHTDQSSLVQQILGYFVGGTCKAFPEKDSPFPVSVATIKEFFDGGNDGFRTVFKQKKQLFTNAKVCQPGYEGDPADCGCAYTKVKYKNQSEFDYWPIRVSPPKAICVDGPMDGQPCDYNPNNPSEGCTGTVVPQTSGQIQTTGGTCSPIETETKILGMTGYCLERDISHPINGLADFSKSETQQYACLTWLPIDVSASNANFFNSSESAGYLPRLDSLGRSGNPTGGQVYCAVGTEAGGRISGGNQFFRLPVASESDVQNLFSSYFGSSAYFRNDGLNLGLPVLRSVVSTGVPYSMDCDHSDSSLYKDFACANSNDFDNSTRTHYQVFQTWAWKLFGNNALVLRSEKKASTMTYSDHDFVGFVNRNSVCTDCIDFQHLFSALYQNGATFGTLMHPPRTWGDISSHLTNTTDLNALHSTNLDSDDQNNTNFQRNVLATGYSPEYALSMAQSAPNAPSTVKADYVDQSEVELNIRENDIDKFYVVPLAFPKRQGGNAPNLLTQTLYIDFNKLNKSSTGADVQTAVDSFYNDETGGATSACSLQNYLPDKRDYDGDEDCRIQIPHYVWTYKQTQATGITSHSNYNMGNGLNYYAVSTNPTPNSTKSFVERNRIASRYVMVYFTANSGNSVPARPNWPPFAPVDGVNRDNLEKRIPGAGSDPLNDSDVRCSVVEGHTWFAIGLDFNDDGEFLGYVTRWCSGHASQNDPNGMMVATVATVNNLCTSYTSVYDNSSAFGTNKAWTNRVWKNAMGPSVLLPSVAGPLRHPYTAEYSIFLRDYGNQPFGSLPFNTIPTDPKDLRNSTFRYQPSADSEPNTQPVDYDGAIYACDSGSWLGLNIVVHNLCLPQDGNIGQNGNTKADGYNGIQQLFAQIYQVVSLNSYAPLSYQTFTSNDASLPNGLTSFDRSGDQAFINQTTAGQPLVAPQIFSVNPARCKQGSSLPCTAGEANNFTINDHNATLTNYDGIDPPSDEDLDYSGFADPLISTANYPVDLKFFAWADDNRMPIRRVVVDWRDGTENFDSSGYFKNRKPFCSDHDESSLELSAPGGGVLGQCGTATGSSITFSGLTCKQDKDCPVGSNQLCYGLESHQTSLYEHARFGNTNRACDSGRQFLFHHEYTCDSNNLIDPSSAIDPATGRHSYYSWVYTIADLAQPSSGVYDRDAYDRLTGDAYGSLPESTRICVFKPRVQVTDNWGWCNGVCVGHTDGCYGALLGEGTLETGRGITSQCLFLDDTRRVGTPSRPVDDPWTYYKGNIIVLPSN